ncbi:uncharacterized protein LOC114828083 [Galendromus occidentalis]|uniref:Uncharacterized protein LOC114828083 n=1 Tax=Galendromus occidentalis TaxID=34638 RepID=A0AAJ7SDF3_9ACAR|nr:uncharacterized protein LOC114828083 [Galendromus occidentalis]
MFGGSLGKTSRYKQYFNSDERTDDGGTVMNSLSLVEKRLKLVNKRRAYSTLEEDCEETTFHENNNSLPIPGPGLPAPEGSPGVCQTNAKTKRRSRNIICALAIASLVLLVCRFAVLFHRAKKSSQMPYYFYFVHEVVLHNLTIDSNMATLSMPNGTRAIYCCAKNTVVCSKTEESSLIWKRALIHKIENIQCNDAACIVYGNNTVTALEPTQGGFMWTLRIKAQPYLMSTSWGSRIVVFHNEYIIIYRQDTGRATTHIRIKNCTRISRIQPVGARLAVLCQQGLNTTSASLYIIPKSVLLHSTSLNQDKPIPADFAGFFKLPVRLHTYNDTVLYILHDKGVVSTLSITERKIEDILKMLTPHRDLLPVNSTHTLIQTLHEFRIYTSRGIVWRKNIQMEDFSYIRRLSQNLIMLKNTDGRLSILDILSKNETLVNFTHSFPELLLINGTDRMIFTASHQEPNDTTIKTLYYR